MLVVNQICITHETTVQGSILPEQAKSWASPTSRPVVRNRLHFPWCCHSLELFDLGHCTATTMCTVILSSWLSSSSRSSFVFVTKFYHYVSGWIWFDLEVCTYKFLLMLQHILILHNPMFDLSYACWLHKWQQRDMEFLIVIWSIYCWFCGLVTIVPTCKQLDAFDIFCLQFITPAESNNVLFLF